MSADKCKNCGQRIQKVNLALGAEWYHVTSLNASFPNDYERYCRLSVAEPESPTGLSAAHMPVGSVCGRCRREDHTFSFVPGWAEGDPCPCCEAEHAPGSPPKGDTDE